MSSCAEAVKQVILCIEQTRERLQRDLNQEELTQLEQLEKYLNSCKLLFDRQPTPTVSQEHYYNDEDTPPEDRVSGPFFRLAKGGIIHGEDEEVFVPEIWVRKLGIEHGDWLAADPLGVLHDSMLYEFTVLERRQRGAYQERISIVGPLMYHAGEWMIYSQEEETTITVNPREVRSLGLREGDLVEVAYMKGDMSQVRIAWKYDQETLNQQRTGPGKAKQRGDSRPTVDVADPLLAGRNVLVVGADLYKDAFRQMFERRGAKFSWESGFQGGPGRSIEAKVRASDIVVIVTEMMSHRLPDVENMCRRLNKPFVYAPSKGSAGAIREVQQKIRLLQFQRKL